MGTVAGMASMSDGGGPGGHRCTQIFSLSSAAAAGGSSTDDAYSYMIATPSVRTK